MGEMMERLHSAMIAHDLRGPVSVVLNLLDLLLDQWDGLDDVARRERVERSMARAGALAGLTDDIFDMSFLQGHRQLTDVYLLGLAVKRNGRLATFDRTIPTRAVAGAERETLLLLGGET